MRTTAHLTRALKGSTSPLMRPLPDRVAELLLLLDCPPRLAAHLRAVHDVAHQLVDWVEQHCPDLDFDREAVLFGAATHDIGKTVHTTELSEPGSAREDAGRLLLLSHGFSPELARFAATHASWTAFPDSVEDLLVSLADKVWKNKRIPELEDLVVARLALANDRAAWEEFIALDEMLMGTGEGADQRLAFQASFPVHG